MPDPSLIKNKVAFTSTVLAGLRSMPLWSAEWDVDSQPINICIDFSECHDIFPDVIELNPSGHYYSNSFDTRTGAPLLYLLKGIKELADELDAKQVLIDDLTTRVTALENP